MTRPASSFLGIARLILIIRKANVLVRAFNSVEFIARSYLPNQQSAIGNRQFRYEFRIFQISLAAAGNSAGSDGLFLVGQPCAAKIADAIRRGAAAFVADGGHFAG